jgi:hypothetical protein
VSLLLCSALAALHRSLTVDGTDTEANWLREFGGAESDLGRIFLDLLARYRAQESTQRYPVEVSASLGVSGTTARRSTGPVPHPTVVPLSRPQLIIVPGVEFPAYIRNLFLALLPPGLAPSITVVGAERVETPSHHERGHVVPPSLVPTDAVGAHLGMIVVTLHCDLQGRVRVVAEVLPRRDEDDASAPEQRFWYPDDMPDFIDVLAAVFRSVFDCIVVVVAGGGWTLHLRCQAALKELASAHRLVFVLPRRIVTLYLQARDPTLSSFLRFAATVLPEVLQLQTESREPGSLISRLRDIALAGTSVLRDSASSTFPLLIDHERQVVEINSEYGSNPASTEPVMGVEGSSHLVRTTEVASAAPVLAAAGLAALSLDTVAMPSMAVESCSQARVEVSPTMTLSPPRLRVAICDCGVGPAGNTGGVLYQSNLAMQVRPLSPCTHIARRQNSAHVAGALPLLLMAPLTCAVLSLVCA